MQNVTLTVEKTWQARWISMLTQLLLDSFRWGQNEAGEGLSTCDLTISKTLCEDRVCVHLCSISNVFGRHTSIEAT